VATRLRLCVSDLGDHDARRRLGVYGIGGGSILAPVLVSFGLSVRAVAPAALTSTFLTSVVGIATYGVLSLLAEGSVAPEGV
jgi:uncharacterized protein